MRFPKKSRKLTIDGAVWHWKYGEPRLWIWDPEGKRHEVHLDKFPNARWDSYDWEGYGTVNPGDVRKYIEENIMEDSVEFRADMTAVPGKLYVYRHKTLREGPTLSIMEISGDLHMGAKKKLEKLFLAKHPLLLVDYRVNVVEKKSYCKFIIVDIMCTLRIEYPRTWRGAFALHEEWAKSAEAQEQVG